MNVKPNQKDLKEWFQLCEWIESQPYKRSYRPIHPFLVSQHELAKGMRRWLREQDLELIFYSNGWGWRLRKDWRNRYQEIQRIIKDEKD